MPFLQVGTTTKAERKKEVVKKLKQMAGRSLEVLERNHKKAVQLVWQNPDLTPQEVFDALGVEASEALQIDFAGVNLVNQFKPDTIDLSELPSTTINEDGTVTVN